VKGRNPKRKRPSDDGSISELQRQYEEMEAQLDEAEETLRAIREGEVDAFAVSTAAGHRIYTLEGSDRAYRLLIEDISEGALTLTGDGLILFCNRRFAEIVGKPIEKVIGSSIFTRIAPADKQTVRTLLGDAPVSGARAEISLIPASGRPVPVLLSATPLPETDPPGACLVVTDLTECRKPASLDHVAAGIARDIRNPLSKMNRFLSALDKICQGSKTLEPKRRETAKEIYLKAKSASEKIEEVARRVMSPTEADTKEGLKIRKKLRPTRGSPG
jgi:PAS domain S-box-containing protein